MTTDSQADTGLILALPRLRTDFLPHGVTGLWPGLPRIPAGCWQPAYPWSPAQATSCLADHEATPDLPAQSWLARSLQRSPGQYLLRPEEEAALAGFSGNSAMAVTAVTDQAEADKIKPEQAQSALILSWLQEGRVLDMVRLRQKLAQAEAKQKALFSGFEPEENLDESSLPELNPDESSLLPPWAYVLNAAALFLPPECCLYCANAALAAALVPSGPAPQRPALSGCHLVLAPLPGVPQSAPRLWHVPLHFEMETTE